MPLREVLKEPYFGPFTAISASVAGLGSIGLAVYSMRGINCPFQSFGGACPGCGCGRAVTALVQDGPFVMFHDQPTASVFLLLWLILAIALFLLRWRSSRKYSMRSLTLVGGALVLIAAVVNVVYQWGR